MALILLNFAQLKRAEYVFSRINALVGENNSGKTAILRAINCLFNYDFEKEHFINHAHQYAPRNNTRIEFSVHKCAPPKQFMKIKVSDNKLILGFEFKYSNNKRTLYCLTQQGRETIDDDFIINLKNDIDYIYIPTNRE